MAESGFPDFFDDFVSSPRTAERVATSVHAKATSLESELAAALQRENKLKHDLGKLEAECKSAQNVLRTKEAELEIREKKLRAEEDEVRKDRAELAEDLARTTKSMRDAFERHTIKRRTKSEPPENACPLGVPCPLPIGAPDDSEPAFKRTRLQEPTSTPAEPMTLQTKKKRKKKPTSHYDVLTFLQKKELCEAIAQLDGEKLEKVIKIVHEGVPEIKDSKEEIELEIDLLPPSVLTKLYDFVLRPPAPSTQRKKTAKGTNRHKGRKIDADLEAEKIRMLERRMALYGLEFCITLIFIR
ncbi:hypothetical protein C8R43DRAFT_943948 [Mycena crocata]|nr:hypothetical protein C8R43DRAFT_943948 [Mycena crocata]